MTSKPDYDVIDSRPGFGIGACTYAAVIRDNQGPWRIPGRFGSSAAATRAAKAAIKAGVTRQSA